MTRYLWSDTLEPVLGEVAEAEEAFERLGRMLENLGAKGLGLTVLVCTTVTMLTSGKRPTPRAIAFYERLRIHGRGWGRVRELTNVAPVAANPRENAIACLGSIGVLYCLLLGTGYLLFGDWLRFGACLLLGLPCGYLAHTKLRDVMARLRTPVSK